MYELYPYFTNDGSVGLYSPRSHDIYHSAYGALSEAYEKFILPAELMKTLEIKSNIKVLDICYGIGYNTKSFLNFVLEYFSKKNYEKKIEKICKKNNRLDNNTGAIYTDNDTKEVYTEQLYTDNVLRKNSACKHHEKQFENSLSNYNFYIKAIDVDKNLFFLSPFFKNGNKADRKHNKLNFHYEKISKFLEKDFDKKYKLKNEVNIILLLKIIENNPEILENDEIIDILNSPQYAPFFDPFMRGLFRFCKKRRSINTYSERIGAFLHNI